jgi:hypothetical protein
MMILTTEKKSATSLLLVGCLFVLPGCFGEKAKAPKVEEELSSSQTSGSVSKGDVLLSIDGKPVLYVEDFEDQKAMAQQSNQQLNMILQMMPDAEYSMLFKSIEAGYLMKEWVIREGIDQKPELKKQLRQYQDAIELQLYMKYYEDAHPINVTEHEAEAYYKAKRDQMPGLILSGAGVTIVYVKFDTKAKAESFANKVKDGSEKHFKAAVKDSDFTIENLVITSDSTVNEALKNSVLAATKFPSKEVVKIDDNTYWVVGIIKKKDPEYRSFDTPEIKQAIIKMCKDEKREVELTQQIEELNKKYKVVENKAYFDNKKQNNGQLLKDAQQIVLQAQEELDFQEEDSDLLDDKI